MAKKVIARTRSKGAKNFAKVIRAVRSQKTGAYGFKEDILPLEEVKKLFQQKDSSS